MSEGPPQPEKKETSLGVQAETRDDGLEYVNVVPVKSEKTRLEWRKKLEELIKRITG